LYSTEASNEMRSAI